MTNNTPSSKGQSKLPEWLEPISDFSFYGIKPTDMNREDLLKVIKWLSDEMMRLRKLEEEHNLQVVKEFKAVAERIKANK